MRYYTWGRWSEVRNRETLLFHETELLPPNLAVVRPFCSADEQVAIVEVLLLMHVFHVFFRKWTGPSS